MTTLPLILPTWARTHSLVQGYLIKLTNDHKSRAWASQAIGLWVRNALDGVETLYGPYQSLFEAAGTVAARDAGMRSEVSAADWADGIPLQVVGLPYDLSRLYVQVWKGGKLADFDRSQKNAISKLASDFWPGPEGGWVTENVSFTSSAAALSARRAFDLLHDHECAKCLTCAEAAHRWDAEDRATEVWLTSQRLAREGI